MLPEPPPLLQAIAGPPVRRPLSRLLFVDDEPAMCRAFQRLLQRRGLIVDIAASGAEAMKMARRRFYPVVVTDLQMPQMDGLTLIERLQPLQPHTAFIVLTAFPEFDRTRRQMLRRGMVQVLTKPLDASVLIDAINRALELRSSQEARVPSVLLVDEDAHEADRTCQKLGALEGGPYVVLTAQRLSEAIAILHDRQIDVVLTELSLPDAMGLDAVRSLSAAAPEVAVVVLTSLDDDRIGLRAIQLGAEDYLVKGEVSRERLQRVVRFAHERRAATQRVVQLAHYDQLTGLSTRASFRRRLDHGVALAKRNEGQLAVLFIDLDNFKPVNDIHGHDAGDRLLCEVADRLRQSVRGTDMVARLGGDEFTLLVSGLGRGLELDGVIERVRCCFDQPVQIASSPVELSASVGVAIYPRDGATAAELLEVADAAMYVAKTVSGTEVVYAQKEPARGIHAVPLRFDLERALAENELSLWYQPQCDLASATVLAVEALLRWSPADRPRKTAADLIPFLDASAQIVPVGHWVLDQACRQVQRWRESGRPLRVAINVSAVELAAEGYVEAVSGALVRSGLLPDALELELRESALLAPSAQVETTLAGLAALGVRLAIDDFGVGPFSLIRLERIGISTLKIHGSLVRRLGDDRLDPCSAVVRAIVDIGRRFELDVIAEGIEEQRQLVALRQLGCELGQGYLLGCPQSELPAHSTLAPPEIALAKSRARIYDAPDGFGAVLA